MRFLLVKHIYGIFHRFHVLFYEEELGRKTVATSVQIGILAAVIAGTAELSGSNDVIDVGAGQVCTQRIWATLVSSPCLTVLMVFI